MKSRLQELSGLS